MAFPCEPVSYTKWSHPKSRLKRYFEPANGRTVASPEALAMFKDKNKRLKAETAADKNPS